MRRLSSLYGIVSACFFLASCGGNAAPQLEVAQPTSAAVATVAEAIPTTPAPTPIAPTATLGTASVVLKQVQFAKNIQGQQAVDPGAEFEGNQTVYLAIDIEGRPKRGMLEAAFYWHDTLIVTTTIDLADANGDVLFSVGQDTFASFSLSHTDPLPISAAYRAEVFYEGERLGSYPFAVVPPADALASKLLDVTLARDADASYAPIDPATTFGPTQQVVLAGTADLGLDTWIQVEWLVDGEIAQAGTRSFTMRENKANTPFAFAFLPDGGWPLGEHEVVLKINDGEAGRYAFTIADDVAAVPATESATTPAAPPAEPAMTTEETATTSDVPAGDTSATLAFAAAQTYTLPTGLFQIDIPADWESNDLTDENGAYVSWIHPSGEAIVTVIISEYNDQMNQEQITEEIKSFITDVRSEPDAVIGDAEPQTDGSVLMPWTYSIDRGDSKQTMQAVAYAEQRGNKMSFLIFDVPADQYEQLWANGLRDLVNSYKIDPAASFVR